MKRRIISILVAVVLFGAMAAPAATSSAVVVAQPQEPLRNWRSQRHSGTPRYFTFRHISWFARTSPATTNGANGQNFSVALVPGRTPNEAAVLVRNVRRNGEAQLAFNDRGGDGWFHFRYTRNAPGDNIAINSHGNVLMQSSITPWRQWGDV